MGYTDWPMNCQDQLDPASQYRDRFMPPQLNFYMIAGCSNPDHFTHRVISSATGKLMSLVLSSYPLKDYLVCPKCEYSQPQYIYATFRYYCQACCEEQG